MNSHSNDPRLSASDPKTLLRDATHALLSAKRELACSICLDLVLQPVLLPCGHTFCATCIASSFRASASGDALRRSGGGSSKGQCPLCKAVVSERSLVPVPLLQDIVTAIGTLADHYGVDDVTTLTQDDIRRICPPTPVFSFTATTPSCNSGGAVVAPSASSSLSQNKKHNKAPPPQGLFASTSSSSSSSLFPAAAVRSDEVEEAQERLNRDEEEHPPPPQQGGQSLFGSYVETMPVSDGSLPPSSACLLSPWRYSQTNAYRSLSMGPEDPPPLLLLAANHHQQQHASCCIVAEDDPRHRQEHEDDENASGKFARPRTSAEACQEFRTTTFVGPSDSHNNNEEVPNNEFVGSSSASLSLGRHRRSGSSPPLSSSSDDRLCETQVLPESRPSTDLGKNKRHSTRRTCESGDRKVDATTPTAQRTSTSAAALTGDVTPSLPKPQRQTTTSSSIHTHSQPSPTTTTTTTTTEAEAAGPAISRTIEATLPTDDATARVVWIRAALSIPTTAFPLSQQQQPKRDRSTTSLTFSYTAIAAVVNPGATTTTAATAVCSPARPYDYISEKIHFQKRWISAASDPQLAQLQQPAAGEVEQVAVPEVSSPVSSTSSCVCCFCGLTISDRQKVKHRLRAIVRFNKAYHQQQQQDQHVGDSRRSSTEQQQQQQATAAEAESMAWLASITEDTLEALLGPLVTVAATTSAEQEGGAAVVSELKAHRACLWHSAEVALRYIPHVTSSSSFSSKPLAVGDIAVENVLSALKRGKLLKCAVCGEKGATLGCARSRCRKSFHVGCALWADSCVVEDRAPPAVIQAVVDGCSVSQQLPNNNLSYRGFAPHTATVSSPSSSSNNKPKKRGRSSQTNDEDGESGPLQEGSSGSVTIPKMQVWCVCCFDRTMK